MRPEKSDAVPLSAYAIFAASILALTALIAAVWHGVGAAFGKLAC